MKWPYWVAVALVSGGIVAFLFASMEDFPWWACLAGLLFGFVIGRPIFVGPILRHLWQCCWHRK